MATEVVSTTEQRLSQMGLMSPIGQVDIHWREGQAFHDLTGATIGFLDNTFAGANHLLSLTEERFKQNFQLRDTMMLRKFIYSRRATPEQIQELSDTCDIVVVGIGG